MNSVTKLGADQSALGLAYLVSALIGVGSGYLGGHLSDHFGRRPLIFIAAHGLRHRFVITFHLHHLAGHLVMQ